MKIISVRENPEYKDRIITYLQRSWPTVFPQLYSDCIDHWFMKYHCSLRR